MSDSDFEATASQADKLIAAEIRAELARARVTQSALAKRLGVSRAWVSRRLSGDVPLSVGVVAGIAAQLGVDFATLAAPVDGRQRSDRSRPTRRKRVTTFRG
jgi:transcriptional regulator with XRE-family HTH domain